MFEKIKALFAKYGIQISQEKENEIKVEVDKLEPTNAIDWSKIDLSKVSPEMKPILETMSNQNKILVEQVKQLTDTLGAERAAREASAKATQEEAKKAHDKKVSDAVEKLFKDKKIVEADKSKWKTDFETNFDMAERMAALIPVPKQLQGKETTPPAPTTGTQATGTTVKTSPHKALAEAIREQMGSNEKV